ncbi:c-type cytochrome [Variovorax sp. KK3]|uniref:c-type cytochrome n=1 Tax=Variovorax sp. KK3 TaxID=1855728 RepID=UPI00097C6BF9|nr:c-type cytochrome [Variovorax sp. KK3]
MTKTRQILRRALSAAAFGLCALAHAASPAPGQVPDTIEQRVAACIACHGRERSSANAGYFPRLAGKPEQYLYNQLLSFRDGRRFNSDMAYMVRHLSDDYLREIARYFAELDLMYPPPPTRTDASAQTLARGKALAFEGDAARGIPACATCHGQALTGIAPAIPSLLGLPRLYLASQLGDWLNDGRHAPPPDCMAEVGRKLDAADINAVASWLAMQPVPADPKPAAAPAKPLPMRCSAMGK